MYIGYWGQVSSTIEILFAIYKDNVFLFNFQKVQNNHINEKIYCLQFKLNIGERKRIQTYLTAPNPIASEVVSSSSSVQPAILPEQNHRRVM